MDIYDRIHAAYQKASVLEFNEAWKGPDNISQTKNLLQDKSLYPKLLSNFGDGRISQIARGLNCPGFWELREQHKNFDAVICELEAEFSARTGWSLEDIEINDICGIYGKPGKDGIVPPAFYRLGYNLHQLANLASAPTTILEIGAGFGGLAHLCRKKFENLKYVIVDIPSSLAVSSYFLDTLGYKVCLYGEYSNLDASIEDYDCVLLPPKEILNVKDRSMDLVVNVNSLTEMPTAIRAFYLEQIARVCKLFFYADNADSHLIDTQCMTILKGFERIFMRNHNIVETRAFDAGTTFTEQLFRRI